MSIGEKHIERLADDWPMHAGAIFFQEKGICLYLLSKYVKRTCFQIFQLYRNH